MLPDLGPRVHVHPLQGDAADVEEPEHAAHPHELVHQGRQLPSLYLKYKKINSKSKYLK